MAASGALGRGNRARAATLDRNAVLLRRLTAAPGIELAIRRASFTSSQVDLCRQTR
jgi:hypothetical protein